MSEHLRFGAWFFFILTAHSHYHTACFRASVASAQKQYFRIVMEIVRYFCVPLQAK